MGELVRAFNALPMFDNDPSSSGSGEWVFGFRTTILGQYQEFVFAKELGSQRMLLAGLRRIYAEDSEEIRATLAVELLFRAFVDQKHDPGLPGHEPSHATAPVRWYLGDETLRRPMMDKLRNLDISNGLKTIYETEPTQDDEYNVYWNVVKTASVLAGGHGITGGPNMENCPYCQSGMRPRLASSRIMYCNHRRDVRGCKDGCGTRLRIRHQFECTRQGPINDALRVFTHEAAILAENRVLADDAHIVLPQGSPQFEGFSKPIRRLMRSGLCTPDNMLNLFGRYWTRALGPLMVDIDLTQRLQAAPDSFRQMIDSRLDENLPLQLSQPLNDESMIRRVQSLQTLRVMLLEHLRENDTKRMRYENFVTLFKWTDPLWDSPARAYSLVIQCLNPKHLELQEWERALIAME
ncbi:hypothetical protein K470DRAFT_275329 [Piedraia hortae CBS 480.64]|uniref:MYND-type zinc finger protein samB n=1 Tax=Piedraia hortae CBS 480.64 TaxID=1314780 RepID=A0A6A7C5W0_9PEZI|nr:hypothetical protein K470DRAFT_275329 [Piedraia hortae CBS 480.64]